MSSVKGCSNGECAAHKNKTLFKASMSYCPQCGAELIVVCKSRRCYTRLDGPSKMLCARCEAKHADRIDGIKKGSRCGRRGSHIGLHSSRCCEEAHEEIITQRQRQFDLPFLLT